MLKNAVPMAEVVSSSLEKKACVLDIRAAAYTTITANSVFQTSNLTIWRMRVRITAKMLIYLGLRPLLTNV